MCVILLVRKSMKFELVLLLATPRVPEKCRWSQLLHIFCNSIREWEERELYFNPFHRNHAPSPHIFLFFPHSELPPKYMGETHCFTVLYEGRWIFLETASMRKIPFFQPHKLKAQLHVQKPRNILYVLGLCESRSTWQNLDKNLIITIKTNFYEFLI